MSFVRAMAAESDSSVKRQGISCDKKGHCRGDPDFRDLNFSRHDFAGTTG